MPIPGVAQFVQAVPLPQQHPILRWPSLLTAQWNKVALTSTAPTVASIHPLMLTSAGLDSFDRFADCSNVPQISVKPVSLDFPAPPSHSKRYSSKIHAIANIGMHPNHAQQGITTALHHEFSKRRSSWSLPTLPCSDKSVLLNRPPINWLAAPQLGRLQLIINRALVLAFQAKLPFPRDDSIAPMMHLLGRTNQGVEVVEPKKTQTNFILPAFFFTL